MCNWIIKSLMQCWHSCTSTIVSVFICVSKVMVLQVNVCGFYIMRQSKRLLANALEVPNPLKADQSNTSTLAL